MTSAKRHSQRPCDIDVERLVYGELSREAEMHVREHLARCTACRTEHQMLLLERRAFVARSWLSDPADLPDVEELLARAASEPASLAVRLQSTLRRWSAPWRGAVLQSVLGVCVVALVVHAGRPGQPVGAEPALRAGPVAADSEAPQRFSPDGLEEERCESNEVCVERPPAMGALASSTSASSTSATNALANDASATSSSGTSTARFTPTAGVSCVSAPQSTFAPLDGSSQKSRSNALDITVEAVCAPDAI